MRPKSNQPARLYATAKTHKFNDLDEITVIKLKFRPIVDPTGTATCDATKVIELVNISNHWHLMNVKSMIALSSQI